MLCLVGAMLLTTFWTTGVEAGTIVQTKSVDFTLTDFTAPIPMVFDQYDGSGGPLTSVEIAYTGTMRNRITGTYTVAPVTITYTANGTLTLTGPNSLNLGLAPSFHDSRTIDNDSEDFTDTPLDTTASVSATYTTAGDLAAFEGLGTFNLLFNATATQNFDLNGGNGMAFIDTLAGASVTVTYTLVPEPSSMALTGLGGLVFAWRFGRRRQVAG